MVDAVTGPQPLAKGTQKLGAYTLVRRIGRGGMAEVYLATKEGDLVDRNLVVKRMLPHLADDERFVQMFLREARVAMKLSHPNVVQMLEVGVEGEEYFIAMEHLEGLSAYHLAKRVWAAGKSLPLELVAHTICDAALGLEHAHTLRDMQGTPIGLVHRDISPDNIFVIKNGTTKILDFGIASGAFAGSLTRTGEIKGKVRYMSPEQMTKSTDTDARADVWSLGATLYWMLTGRHAFDGNNDVVAMRAVLESEPPPPSSINPALPKKLDVVVAAMMAKNRDRRVPSAEAAYEALLPFTGGAAGRAKCVEFLNEALQLPPVKKRLDGEDEPELAVPAAMPGSWASNTLRSPIGELSTNSGTPTPPEQTVRSPVSRGDITVAQTAPDAPPEHGTEASGEATSSTPYSGVDGETLDSALRPGARPKRRGVVLVAAAGVLGIAAAAVVFAVGPGLPTLEEIAPPALPVAASEPAAPVATTPTAPTADPIVPATAPTTDAGTTTTATATTATDAPPVPRAPVAATTADAGTTTTTPQTAPIVEDKAPPVVDEKVPPETPDAPEAAVAAAPVEEKPAVVEDDKPDVKERGERRVARAAKPTVRVKAPGHVEWRTIGGALLGKGSGTLTLPRETTQIVAVDSKRKGRARVGVADEMQLDYGALPKGELTFVVVPFADVYLGKEHLGRTPISGAVSVVAGSYEVRLVWNDKTKIVKVDVDAGKRVPVRANMAQ